MASKGMSEDITVELLSRLPAKSLMQFKSLNKSFSDLVTRPSFITKHFRFSNENPHLLIFHYQSNLSSSLCISLFSDELPWTPDDSALQIREILQNALDLGPEQSKPLVDLGILIPVPEGLQDPLDLGLPFSEESLPPRDFGLTFIAPPCIDMPVGITEISQPAVDMGLTFPESSQLPSDACLPFQTVSQALVPKRSQPFVDLELPFPDKYVLEIVPYGPCNGIFCLYGSYLDSPDQFILWNPATKEVKVLPLPHHPPSGVEMCTYGFGLDPGTNDYKVVSILMGMGQQLAFEVSGETQIPLVEVYSLSTNSWRKIDVAVPAFDFSYSIFNSYLNGVYHWLAKSSNVIVCFDMSNEVFYTMKLPLVIEDYTNEHLVDCHVAVFNDSIAYVKEYLSQLLFDRIEIWVMNKHGAEESWTKRYSIGPLLGLGKFWGFWKDGEILTKVEDKGTLISYKLETQQPVLKFPVPSGSMLFAAFKYVESIFPISVLAEEQA